MINYTCPKCGEAMSSPESMAGQPEKCPACGNVAVIPAKRFSQFHRRAICIAVGVVTLLGILFAGVILYRNANADTDGLRPSKVCIDQAEPNQSHKKPENRQRFYSRKEYRYAYTIAIWNKYPSIDADWLRKLIRTTSEEKNIPETELWIIVVSLIKDVHLVPDEKKTEALRQLLMEVVSDDITVRRKSIIRMFHVFSGYENEGSADGTRVYFVFFNYTGRNIKSLRGEIRLFDKNGTVIARLPLVCNYSIRAEGSNDGHGDRIWRLDPTIKAILKPYHLYSRVEFYADEIVYLNGDREVFE